MIDPANDTLLSISQVAKLLPPGRQGRPVSFSCVFRWITKGVKTINGMVRLEVIRCGGRYLTTAEALKRFMEAQTPRFDAQGQPMPRTPAARQRAQQRAEDTLKKIGI